MTNIKMEWAVRAYLISLPDNNHSQVLLSKFLAPKLEGID